VPSSPAGVVVGAPSTSAATPAAPSPAGQLVTILAPLRAAADGTHQLTVVLQPEGLGTVRATVTVAGTAIAVHLVADSAAGHAALSQSLGDLRAQLGQDGGAVSLSLTSDHQAPGREQTDQPHRRQAAAGADETPDSTPIRAVHVPVGHARGLVDLRL
jgi:flagellar hook-length control protein FliK